MAARCCISASTRAALLLSRAGCRPPAAPRPALSGAPLTCAELRAAPRRASGPGSSSSAAPGETPGHEELAGGSGRCGAVPTGADPLGTCPAGAGSPGDAGPRGAGDTLAGSRAAGAWRVAGDGEGPAGCGGAAAGGGPTGEGPGVTEEPRTTMGALEALIRRSASRRCTISVADGRFSGSRSMHALYSSTACCGHSSGTLRHTGVVQGKYGMHINGLEGEQRTCGFQAKGSW